MDLEDKHIVVTGAGSGLGAATARKLDSLWGALTKDQPQRASAEVEVAQGRRVVVEKQAGGVALFSFDELCNTAKGSTDYMAICRYFHTIILTDTPRLSTERRDQLRRFILFVSSRVARALDRPGLHPQGKALRRGRARPRGALRGRQRGVLRRELCVRPVLLAAH